MIALVDRLVANHPVMGTMASLHLISSPQNQTAFDEAVRSCWEDLDDIERVFSAHDDRSCIRRLAAGQIELWQADNRVQEMIELCQMARRRSAGLFDPWSEGWFDPTGYVKGWAVEQVGEQHLSRLLVHCGVEAVGLSLGGDMWLRTNPNSDWVWRVGIADPHRSGRILAKLDIANGAVATSGTAERGYHIRDPRTGELAVSVTSASVVADRLVDADLWATVAVVAGFADLSWIADAGTRQGLLVGQHGQIRRWSGAYEVIQHLGFD